ncbi:hypothetical protein [Bacteroides salyersiae]|uniref:hypothetical protein n=1 Tax=Bacteroides salyersiae TaxID=291644 RepID=UPI001C8B72B9|nr:hypothetical protein [Bacteroides salyersiae]
MKARPGFPAIVLIACMPGAHCPYARCSPSVCLVLTTRMPGAWEVFAQRPESGSALSPCIADE